MNAEVTKNTKVISMVRGRVEGVKTLADMDCALNALLQEGAPEQSSISGFLTGGGWTLETIFTADNTSAVQALRDALVVYLEQRMQEKFSANGTDPSTERSLLNQINIILGWV